MSISLCSFESSKTAPLMSNCPWDVCVRRWTNRAPLRRCLAIVNRDICRPFAMEQYCTVNDIDFFSPVRQYIGYCFRCLSWMTTIKHSYSSPCGLEFFKTIEWHFPIWMIYESIKHPGTALWNDTFVVIP